MTRSQALVKFKGLEVSRQQLFSEVDHLDEKRWYYKPAPEKWSIAQIFYHLHLVEERSLGYVKKKMLGGDSLKTTGITATLRFTFLKWLLLSGYKWKAPQILGDIPDAPDYFEVMRSWNTTRENLKSLIETTPEKLMAREIYKQPMAGRLNMFQMLGFFQDHFDHHLKQIKERLASSKIS